MKTLITLERSRSWENKIWTDNFLQTAEGNAEEKLRSAVAAFLETDEGKGIIEEINYDFNWGDAVMCIPQSIWEKHDLKPIYEGETVEVSSFETVRVEQDEVLCSQP